MAIYEKGSFTVMVNISQGNSVSTYSRKIGREVGVEANSIGMGSSMNSGASISQQVEGGTASFLWDFNISFDENGTIKYSVNEETTINQLAIALLNSMDIGGDFIGGGEYNWRKPIVKKLK